MQHLSVIEHYANMLRVDEAERARRNDVEHRFGFAHAAADDLQDFGDCRLASVSFVKFSPKLRDLSAKLLLHTAGQNLERHDDAQCFTQIVGSIHDFDADDPGRSAYCSDLTRWRSRASCMVSVPMSAFPATPLRKASVIHVSTWALLRTRPAGSSPSGKANIRLGHAL